MKALGELLHCHHKALVRMDFIESATAKEFIWYVLIPRLII